MTTRHESNEKKLQKRMMQELRRWASNRSVKHKGMDEYELEESFDKEGFTLRITREGSEIYISLTNKKTTKTVVSGRVYLEFGLKSDDVFYEED